MIPDLFGAIPGVETNWHVKHVDGQLQLDRIEYKTAGGMTVVIKREDWQSVEPGRKPPFTVQMHNGDSWRDVRYLPTFRTARKVAIDFLRG